MKTIPLSPGIAREHKTPLMENQHYREDGNKGTKRIRENSPIPVQGLGLGSEDEFGTSYMSLHDRGLTLKWGNNFLGKLVLDGILPQPRGAPRIDVTFSIDQNGILEVSACDRTSAKLVSATWSGGKDCGD